MTDRLPNEQHLITHARRDAQAFRALYRHYFPRVYAYVAYRVGRAMDAEDLTADIFMKVVEAFEQFEQRGDGSFTAWLFRIAHNAVSQFYRQQPRAEVLALDDVPDLHSHDPAPDEVLQRKEQFIRLRQRIASLSPRRQEIIRLRFFGGLRNQEIAEALGLDERTVASHLCRAIEDLQRQYEPEINGKTES